PIVPDPELINYMKKRLGLSDKEYQEIMNGPKRSFRDFKTYKKRFERLRPLFFILAKANLVPMSFYLKYCFPMKSA
ncbi:MAG: LPS biosynthesis protein, partial [Bacteroidota bacterium]